MYLIITLSHYHIIKLINEKPEKGIVVQ